MGVYTVTIHAMVAELGADDLSAISDELDENSVCAYMGENLRVVQLVTASSAEAAKAAALRAYENTRGPAAFSVDAEDVTDQ